jgi:hypothetical protein
MVPPGCARQIEGPRSGCLWGRSHQVSSSDGSPDHQTGFGAHRGHIGRRAQHRALPQRGVNRDCAVGLGGPLWRRRPVDGRICSDLSARRWRIHAGAVGAYVGVALAVCHDALTRTPGLAYGHHSTQLARLRKVAHFPAHSQAITVGGIGTQFAAIVKGLPRRAGTAPLTPCAYICRQQHG